MGLRSTSAIFNAVESLDSGDDSSPAPVEQGSRSIKSIDEALAGEANNEKGRDKLPDISEAEKHKPGQGDKAKQEKSDGKEKSDEESNAEEKGLLEKKGQEQKTDPLLEKHKVTIDGQEVEVTLQDLKSDYSGRQAVQKRFTEFDKQKKGWEKERETLSSSNEFIKKEISTIRSDFEDTINQYNTRGQVNKNPLGVVNDLLDKMGVDSNIFNRAVFDSMLPEVARFLDMTETERDAYFIRKENEHLKKMSSRFEERDTQLRSKEETQSREMSLIRQSGLSLEVFHSLREELESAGHEDVTTEKIVDYAKVKPSLDRAVKLVSRTGNNNLGLANKVAEILLKFPTTTDEEILAYIDPSRKAEEAIKDRQPVKKPNIRAAISQDDDEEESAEEYKKFMRRK